MVLIVQTKVAIRYMSFDILRVSVYVSFLELNQLKECYVLDVYMYVKMMCCKEVSKLTDK